MTCSAPKRLLVVAEREPDDMFRSQTDVSDWREDWRSLWGETSTAQRATTGAENATVRDVGRSGGGGLAGEDRYSGGANPQFWARRIHCPVA